MKQSSKNPLRSIRIISVASVCLAVFLLFVFALASPSGAEKRYAVQRFLPVKEWGFGRATTNFCGFIETTVYRTDKYGIFSVERRYADVKPIPVSEWK
jgi:hypothetical protein